eukprot:jgi/Mesvir1/23931/Mv10706-RA.1
MAGIAKKRLALYLTVIAVMLVRLIMGPMGRSGGSAPAASLTSGSHPATHPTGPTCSKAVKQRALGFRPGQLHAAMPDYLKEYAEFHRRELQKAARSNALAQQVKFLVYACDPGHCGGLGDRFKGIVGTFYLAVVTRRVFLIQHPGYPLADFLVPHAIDWESWGGCVDAYSGPAPTALDALQPPKVYPARYVITSVVDSRPGPLKSDLLIADASNSSVPAFHVLLNTGVWDEILDAESAKKNMERRTGAPWSAPSGPRFAWAWHFLFRPSQELRRHMARLRTQLHIPGDGSPWVATHMRVGNSQEFKDNRRSPLFCTVDEGAKDYALCAAHLAGIASHPPFVSAGAGSVDPSSVPIFIASDNEEAIHRMHAHLVAGGHRDDAVSYTGRKAMHVDAGVPNATLGSPTALQGSPYASERAVFMHTLAELLLLSQATCLVTGANSGFSMVAMLLSQDLATGARCYSYDAGVTNSICTVQPDTDPHQLAALPKGTPMVNYADGQHFIYHRGFMRWCSHFLMVGKGLGVCPQPLALDIVFHAVLMGKKIYVMKFMTWKLDGFQELVAGLFLLQSPCRIDVLLSRRGLERETFDVTAESVDQYVTITVYVDNGEMQRAVHALANKYIANLRSIVGAYISKVLMKGHRFRFEPDVNVTMISQPGTEQAPMVLLPTAASANRMHPFEVRKHRITPSQFSAAARARQKRLSPAMSTR